MLISFGHSKLGQKTPAQVNHKLYTPMPERSSGPLDSVKESVNEAPEARPNGLTSWFRNLGKSQSQRDLEAINAAASKASLLSTPEDFQAKTAEFKTRLSQGESLEDLTVEAYAVAREAAQRATGMRPYDCQVSGALAMADGKIAEMMTGEGKTLTAVMPLYLNALAGKGAHLVTVNDLLAQRDAQEMGPIFELLGLTVGTVLENMSPEEKRLGYEADVTYTTDRTLGFDFLRDRTVRHPQDKLQRPLFFALVDEVDQVLLDEARTPLIISGKGEAPTTDYQVFQDIVTQLRPGVEYYVDREDGASWLTESGTDFVENELFRQQLNMSDAHQVAYYHKKRGAIRAEGNAWQNLREHRAQKPNLWDRLTNDDWSDKDEALTEAFNKAEEASEALGQGYQLFAPENLHRTRPLYAALRANTLFEEGVDYLVQDHRVKIVDENKGRTSRGRRFNEGLHQALEAKSQVPIRPESKAITSITYPNLFAKYKRLAGMSGTAASSEFEFQELYDLSVEKVPTNLQFQLNPDSPEKARRHNRIDKPDAVFATKQAKFSAVVEEAVKSYEEGRPVLIGTLSVEANEYVYAKLLEKGVAPGAVRLLNAEHIRGDKSKENAILADAGRSGMITVATNMAGRGVNIKPELVNYKKLAMGVEQAIGDGSGSVTVDVQNEKEAKRLSQWLQGVFPHRVGEGVPATGEALIRVASEKPAVGSLLKAEDFPTKGLHVIGTERAKSRRIDDQLIGRSGRHGAPGQSQFFLSVEDDLFQYFGGSHLESALELKPGQGGKLEGKKVQKLVQKVQSRVAELDFYTREDTTEYDKVLNKQRDAFYAIRDSILELQADLRSKLISDSAEVVTEELAAKLDKRRPTAAEVKAAVAELNGEFGLALDWDENDRIRLSKVEEKIASQLRYDLESAMKSFDEAGAALDEPYRQTLLNFYDEAWSEHLGDMRTLKQGVQWVSFAEKDPELEYKLRGFEVFEEMRAGLKEQAVKAVLPQLTLGAAKPQDELPRGDQTFSNR